MSVLTTTPLLVAPSAGAAVTVVAGVTPAWGAWVPVIAATAAPTAIAGVQITGIQGANYALAHYELDLGTGGAGAEVSIGTLRLFLHNSGATAHPHGLLLPLPLGGIGTGVRVSLRARSDGGAPAAIALSYYENLSSDQVTTSSQVLGSAPSGATIVTLTPSATAWANSAWVTLIASAAADLGLLGLVHGVPTSADGGLEYDLGTGTSGAETVLTTLRETAIGSRAPLVWLPGLLPIPTGTRLAIRLRKAGTNTTAMPVSVLYYTGVSAAAPGLPVLAGELDRRTLTTATGALNATWTGSTAGNWTAGLVALKKT